jgi:hypothetical protein
MPKMGKLPKDEHLNEWEKEVLEAVIAAPGESKYYYATEVGMSTRETLNNLTNLQRRGLVGSEEAGPVWYSTTRGDRLLSHIAPYSKSIGDGR